MVFLGKYYCHCTFVYVLPSSNKVLHLGLSAAFINQSNVQKSKSRKKEIRTVRWSKKSQVGRS